MKDTKNFIYIEGARENNLQNINVTIPKNKFVVVTGISGSGKTSLAFDTVYQEGQRRYMESLSSYARQFLGSFEKPDVDVIEGLSPAISISQRTTSHNPRSTVGTVTEIYDYLRLFFARIGTPYDPITSEPLVKQTIEQMVEILLAYPEDTKLAIMAPVVTREKGTHDKLIQKLLEEGLTRFQIDGENYLSDELPTLQKTKNHDIAVVIDRLLVHHKNRNRLFEALEFSTKRSKGMAWVVINDQETRRFSENYQAQDPNFFIPELEPRLFSFNTPIGACAECNGLGVKMEITETLVLNENLSINEGAILPYQNASEENITLQDLEQLGHIYGYSMDTPFKDLTPRQRQIILYGTTEPVSYSIHSSGGHDYKRSSFEGIIVNLNRRYL
jgi:excinuclease ABC subunit A